MKVDLTPRMKNWIEGLGVHVATATAKGYPTVTVTYTCKVEGNIIKIPLTTKQVEQISGNLAENPIVAIAPGQLGAVRAPYQFKGKGKIEGNELVVAVERIYCTKPGAEAGLRLDVMGYEQMKEFEESRWKDVNPLGVKK
jgi:predicted pyridoxine 5'-phosphate oxidase superfamily flavin-nucleotide-binding protein